MCVNTVYVNCLSGTIVRCVCADITTINHEAKLALKDIHATKREREREKDEGQKRDMKRNNST